MDWSLILPSRERPWLLRGLLQSLSETTDRPDLLEVIISVDDDDDVTLPRLGQLDAILPNIRWNIGPRRTNFSEHYYNAPALASSGRFVQALNDDCLFVTKGWDRTAKEVLESYPWPEVYGRCRDGLPQNRYACFPILSRPMLDALGYLLPPWFETWGADIALYEVCKAAGRCVDLPHLVEHICHHNGLRERDDINVRMASLPRHEDYESCLPEGLRLRAKLEGKELGADGQSDGQDGMNVQRVLACG